MLTSKKIVINTEVRLGSNFTIASDLPTPLLGGGFNPLTLLKCQLIIETHYLR